jgi:hypothetical protein
LLAFADQTDQAVNCTVRAFNAGADPERVLEIEALDSSEWLIWADDRDRRAVDAAESISALAPAG